jgi:predicted GNAT family N-acyltransferase
MSAAGADLEVREARGPSEHDAALALRHEVFVREQGVPLELELDGRDDEATHIVALRDGEIVGTCRLLREGATVLLGRLVVARAGRRRGVAAQMLAEAERWARGRGARRIVLSAQTYAAGLYLAAGYEVRGTPYLEAGIEHVEMELELG